MLENRVSSEVRGRGWGRHRAKLLTWRLDDGCCHVEAQPWEVSLMNVKLLQGVLNLRPREGDVALALYQLGQTRQQSLG